MKITWGRKPKPQPKTTRCDICTAEVSSEGLVAHWLRYHDPANPPRPETEFEVVIAPLDNRDAISVVPCRDRQQAVDVNDAIHAREPHVYITSIRRKAVASS